MIIRPQVITFSRKTFEVWLSQNQADPNIENMHLFINLRYYL